MSKPWDKIRKPPEGPPPIGLGEFNLASGLRVRVDYFSSTPCEDKAGIQFGNPDQQTCGVCARTARQLSEFFAELAAQLESK